MLRSASKLQNPSGRPAVHIQYYNISPNICLARKEKTNVTALLVNLHIALSCQIQSPLNDNPSCFAFSALIGGSMADLSRGEGKQQETWISGAIRLYISCCPAVCDALESDAPLLFGSIEQLLRHQAFAGDRCSLCYSAHTELSVLSNYEDVFQSEDETAKGGWFFRSATER